MPLRFFLYLAELYERTLGKKELYANKLVKIPRPRFIVLYNGKAEASAQMTLRLSDAFKGEEEEEKEDDEDIPLELKVEVYNINRKRNPQIMKRSKSLREYVALIVIIRKYQSKGLLLEAAIEKAVTFCKEHGILKSFMKKYGTEVQNMLNFEFDMKDALEVSREEGREEGREEAREEIFKELAELLQRGHSAAVAMKMISDKAQKSSQKTPIHNQ
jgi:plasmid maintenance system antidote protein VapI